jgi:hypothetical protein
MCATPARDSIWHSEDVLLVGASPCTKRPFHLLRSPCAAGRATRRGAPSARTSCSPRACRACSARLGVRQQQPVRAHLGELQRVLAPQLRDAHRRRAWPIARATAIRSATSRVVNAPCSQSITTKVKAVLFCRTFARSTHWQRWSPSCPADCSPVSQALPSDCSWKKSPFLRIG